MERNREARRTTMAATNGLSRRRQRSSSLRDTPEEDGQVDFPEAVRLRERGNKRERDRDFSNRKKRSRGEGFVQSGNEEGEESSEESVEDEEEYEEDDRAAWVIPPLTASSSLTSSHNNRRSFPPAAKVGRQTTAWKVTEEMIGVPVPRKARSASKKRSHHEYWISGGGGVEEQNHRHLSTSPAGRSIDALSPSASSPSVRKKMKPTGPKSRPPKVSKSSSASAHDEMDELEVAEVLFGLKKQSQCSKNQETNSSVSQKVDSKDSNGVVHDIKPSVSSPMAIPTQKSPQSSTLPQTISPSSKPVLGVAQKRKKLQAENPSNSDQDVAVKVDIEQSAKMEISSSKLEKISSFSDETSEASNLGVSQASMSLEPQKQAIKPEELKPLTKESGGSQDGIVIKEKPVLPKVSSTKLDVDLEDSTEKKRISTVSEVESRQEEKFKIDLMAPPPMALSPERDGLTGLVSDPNLLAQDVEMKKEIVMKVEEKVEKTVKKEAVGERIEEKKTEIMGDKHESPRLDFDKEHESGNASSTKLQQQGQKQQSSPKASIIPKEDKTTQSSSLTLPIAVTGWPGGLPPLGYMPPLQTVVSMDGSSGSSTAVQPPHYPLSIPRPKRCATHQYIARNIYCHQQLTRMNPFWSAAAGSASLYGVAKPYNLNFMPPTENMILGKPLQGGFPGASLNSKQGKGQGTVPRHTGKEKSPEATNFMDAAQKKQLVIQQAPQPVQPGNLLHAPAFIIPLSQHQAAVAATSNPSGPAKSATSSAKTSLSSNSAAGAPVNSSSLPPVVSFNYPNLPANDSPYLAILQNNGYPFPISTHVGAPPPLRGGTQSQAMPCFNGTFYSSQMFHPSQLHQPQPHSQPLVQQANQNTSASSGSSSSNKHPQTQQLRGTQISGNNFLTPTTMQSQQLQKQHVPSSHQSRKRDVELCGENTQSAVDARASHIQKNVYGQNFAVPVPPVNFALMPSATLAGGGNPGEKKPQHQSQQQGLKGGVELIPSQAFAMSFASFNGSNTASGINFSSMAQNPVIFQSLPDMVRHGYQVAPAAQMTQQKNYQISEGKIGSDSSNAEDGRKTIPGKSSNVGQSFNFCKPGSTDPSISTLMGTTVFDGSTRTLNFVSSPANLNRPSRTTTSPVAANGPSQQQQLIQLQKQHAIGSGRTKVPTSSNHQPSPSITTKFPNNHSVFPQNLVQSMSSAQSSLWKNSARTPASQVPAPSTNSAIKNLPQQQGRAPQGQTQISFGGSPRSTSAPSPFVTGSPTNSSISNTTGGSLRTTPMSSKAGPSIPMLQPQPADNSSSSPGQKSSPVCGRNVPSILSTCPSHLSEVKY